MAKNAGWFKHWNNAHEGQTLFNLWATKDTELIAFYWTILELVSRWGIDGKLVINLSTLRSKLSMNSQRSSKLLLKIAQTFEIQVEKKSEESYEVFIHNWLKCNDSTGRRRAHKFATSRVEDRGIDDRGLEERGVEDRREEKRRKTKRERDLAPSKVLLEAAFPKELESLAEIFAERRVSTQLVINWLKTFPDEAWVKQEIMKALSWESANPKRKKINFGAFMNNWLSKGWDRRLYPNQYNRAEQRTHNNRSALEEALKQVRGENEND